MKNRDTHSPSITKWSCPDCGSKFGPEIVSDIRKGKPIQCSYCNITFTYDQSEHDDESISVTERRNIYGGGILMNEHQDSKAQKGNDIAESCSDCGSKVHSIDSNGKKICECGHIFIEDTQIDYNDKVIICTECGSDNVIKDNERGEHICSDCGLVLSSGDIDTGSEVRIFTQDDKDSKSRTGPPTDIHGQKKNMSTYIGTDKNVTPSQRAVIYRIRKEQIRLGNRGRDRSLKDASNVLDRIAGQINIPKNSDIRSEAIQWYAKAIDKKITNSRSIEAMAAACLYLSCRMREHPRPLSEFARQAKETEKKIGEYYRLMVETFNLKVPIVSPIEFIPRLISELHLTPSEHRDALYILEKIKEIDNNVFVSKDVKGFAAASVYMASIKNNNRVTQRDVAQAAGITEVTVRNRYKEIKKKLGSLWKKMENEISTLKKQLNTIPVNDDNRDSEAVRITKQIKKIQKEFEKISGYIE